jgi:hypothetical protein
VVQQHTLETMPDLPTIAMRNNEDVITAILFLTDSVLVDLDFTNFIKRKLAQNLFNYSFRLTK